MTVGAFGLGIAELIIVLILGGGVLTALVVAGVVLFAATRSRTPGQAGHLGEPFGQPTRLRLLSPSDKPVAESARWEGDELHVRSDDWSIKSLFDVPLNNIDQCMIGYRFRIKTENLQSAVYPELWCRIPEKGQFFSRGLNQKVRGTNEWKEVEIPFYLLAGQQADLVHLNLVFQGPGQVRLKDIELLATPTK